MLSFFLFLFVCLFFVLFCFLYCFFLIIALYLGLMVGVKHVYRNGQGRSQPHSPGWAIVPLSSFFPEIWIKFSYFSSNFSHFLPHFGPPGGQVAHPGRPWLCHWKWPIHQILSHHSLFYITKYKASYEKESKSCNNIFVFKIHGVIARTIEANQLGLFVPI